MPEIPPQAVQAAIPQPIIDAAAKASSMHYEFCDEPRWQDCAKCVRVVDLTERALKAAAPLLVEQARAEERARIVAQLRANAERFHGMAAGQETVGAGWQCHEKAWAVAEVADAIENAGQATIPPKEVDHVS